MAKRSLKNGTDYYLAVAVFNDMAATMMAEEREYLGAIISAYEEGMSRR